MFSRLTCIFIAFFPLGSQSRYRRQNKHYWTVEKDKALIDGLVKLPTNPLWQVRNRFQKVYLTQLERMVKEKKIQQTTVKVVPNIDSL